MGRSQYIIRFGGLPAGVHDFEFQIKDAFFKNIENSEIQTASVDVEARLTKMNNVLQVHFKVTGTVGVDCDRCLKGFAYPIYTEENLVVKHGNTDESTDEILVIPEGVEEFDVAQYLYEYIVLALPARRVPCELDEKKFQCDYETLGRLNDLEAPDKEEEEDTDNPIWEKLNKIKYNKN